MSKLKHHNIVSCFEVVEEEKQIWILMEYSDGGSLRELLDTYGRLP